MQHIVPHLKTLIAASFFAGLALTALLMTMVFFIMKKGQSREIRAPSALTQTPRVMARDSPRPADQASWSNSIPPPITAAYPSERTQLTSHLPTQRAQTRLPSTSWHTTPSVTHGTSRDDREREQFGLLGMQQAEMTGSDQSCFEFLITSNEAHCAFATNQGTAIISTEASIHAMSDFTHEIRSGNVQPKALRLVRRRPNTTRPSTMHNKSSSLNGMNAFNGERSSSNQVRRTKSLDYLDTRQQASTKPAYEASVVHQRVKTINRHANAPSTSFSGRGGLRMSSTSLPQLLTTTLKVQPTMFCGSKGSTVSLPFESVTEASTFKRLPSDDGSYGDGHIEIADHSLSRSGSSRRRSVNSITGSERGHLRIVTVI